MSSLAEMGRRLPEHSRRNGRLLTPGEQLRAIARYGNSGRIPRIDRRGALGEKAPGNKRNLLPKEAKPEGGAITVLSDEEKAQRAREDAKYSEKQLMIADGEGFTIRG